MRDCPVGKKGITVCAWALARAAAERGVNVHISDGPPRDQIPALRFKCLHNNHYWVRVTEHSR